MLFLKEICDEVTYVTEENGGKKNLYIEGVFLQCIPNRNGRIYPEAVMHKEVNRYVKECVNKKRSFGELGHPPNPQINLDRVSHIVESLKIDGKNVMGRAKILETPMGNIVRGLIEGGASIGVSSRGLGSLKDIKEGLKEVQDDFKLVTAADCVADPSAPDAWVTGIMENVEWFFNDRTGDWEKTQLAEEAKKHLKTLSKRQIEESKLRLFEYYLKSI